MTGPRIAPAAAGDLAAIEAYTAARSDTCMIVRSNLRRVGLAWTGARYQAQYVVAWRDDRVVGVVGHNRNGVLLIQADEAVAELAVAATTLSGRPVGGFLGPAAQAAAARRALGLADAPCAVDGDEVLMTLPLNALRVPAPLAAGEVHARLARPADRDALIAWRIAYDVEALGDAPGPETERHATLTIDACLADDTLWVLERDGELVAMTAFNAVMPDCVQVGGVFTPPALRGRGYARAAVAGSLCDARAAGATRAVLFAQAVDACAAYAAIGFTVEGRFAMILLATPTPPRPAA